MNAPESPNKQAMPWDQIAKGLIESKGPQEIVYINREAAAQGQIESAILIWFLEGDVASIHALSVAAQELLHTAGKKVGKPSKAIEYINSKSKGFQKRTRSPQNFFKHGHKDPTVRLRYPTVMGEAHLLDAVRSFMELYDKRPPLMRLFGARFMLEFPGYLAPGYAASAFVNGANINDLAHLCRSEFLVACLIRVAGSP